MPFLTGDSQERYTGHRKRKGKPAMEEHVISVSRKPRRSDVFLCRLMAVLAVVFLLQKQFAEGITGSVK